MLFNDRRKTRGLPNPDTAVQTYGLNLPGGSKKRTMKEYNARAAVLAVGRAGSIQTTEKPKKAPSKLSQKIGGMIMGTGSSNIKTVKANRAAIDAELTPDNPRTTKKKIKKKGM
jgi:hypothetical protein